MKPATNKHRATKAKLEALIAAPGTEAEGKAAQKKLDRLLKNYDFSQADISKDDIFKGEFEPSNATAHIYNCPDYSIASSVKWAIEEETGIRCEFRGAELVAQAAPSTANKLAGIAQTITESFLQLWKTYIAVPGTKEADRNVFIMGLYDGMMGEAKPALLPSRGKPEKVRKAKKKAITTAIGIELHPYSIAVNFGKQIRFSTPWAIIAAELEPLTRKEIAA